MSLTPPAVLRRIAAPRVRVAALATRRPELPVLLVLAAVLYLWALDRNGMANEYYAAAVRSMSTSWHAFLYGSFDVGGIMTVDKPPLALWVQALSVRAFGFSSWSMLVPQALMGVATVALVYDFMARRFGRIAGSVSALVLILTPISVAISRHNNPDALLILCVTAALWCLVRGLEDGRMRWIILSGVCVGLGFEAKMAAALLVVPAIAAAWLWVAPRGRARRAAPVARRRWRAGRRRRCLAAADGADPGRRSALDLGNLGQQHLVADLRLQRPRPARGPGWRAGSRSVAADRGSLVAAVPGGPGGAQNPLFGGPPGRCALSRQAWAGRPAGCSASRSSRSAPRSSPRACAATIPATGWLIGIGGAFVTTAIAFSVASGIFHPYYVSALAPFTAALRAPASATR